MNVGYGEYEYAVVIELNRRGFNPICVTPQVADTLRSSYIDNVPVLQACDKIAELLKPKAVNP